MPLACQGCIVRSRGYAGSGFCDPTRADATGAYNNTLYGAVYTYTHALQIGLKGALNRLDQLQADTALLLGNTAMGDTTPDNFALTTGAALLAHLLTIRFEN
jgi:hypothetical protein